MIVGSSYKISGTILKTQPTSGQWIPRGSLGIDGNGHAVYPALREFEMLWDLVDWDVAHQIQDFYDTVSNTGTVSVHLPPHLPTGTSFDANGDITTNYFREYSGCVLREPEFGPYFQYNRQDVKLLIVRIKTE